MTKDRDHFIKQRKNLILISLFSIFYEAADLEIKELSLFGNKMIIGNPEIISISIFVFFLYFLWRYISAFSEIFGLEAFKVKIRKRKIDNGYKLANKSLSKKTKLKAYDEFHISDDRTERHKQNKKFCYSLQSSKARLTDEQKTSLREHSKFCLNRFDTLRTNIYSILSSCVQDTEFGEYIFPLILATLGALELLNIGLSNML